MEATYDRIQQGMIFYMGQETFDSLTRVNYVLLYDKLEKALAQGVTKIEWNANNESFKIWYF